MTGWIGKLADAFFAAVKIAVAWLFTAQAQALGWLWSWIVGLVLDGWNVFRAVFPSWISQHFPQWNAIPWLQINAFLYDITWILPVREVLAIVAAALVSSASIRLIRWAIGVLPVPKGGG